MKQIWFSVCLLTGSLLYSSIAPAQPTASGALLQQMSSASRSLNYELAYISISKQGIESLRYRHAVIGNVPLGQLLHMDGPRREVLQRGGGISYFEPGLEPFTLTGDHIVDALPAIVYADFTRLAKYYCAISIRWRVSFPAMCRRAMCPMWCRSRLSRPIAHWNRSVATALFIPGCIESP